MKRVAILAALGLAGCTDPQTTREVAEAQGFTDVQVGGYDAWACAKDDTHSTAFTARGVNGKCVAGVVCSGFLKGATLRITGQAPCGADLKVPQSK